MTNGDRPLAGKPGWKGLTRDAIALAALEVIDTRGLALFGLRGVAQNLQVRAASLYNHVQDRAELFRDVGETIYDTLEDVAQPDGDWRTRTVSHSLALRRALLAHPRAAPLVPLHLSRDRCREDYRRALVDAPFTDNREVAIEMIEVFTLGSTLLAAAVLETEQRKLDRGPIHRVDVNREAAFVRSLEIALDAIGVAGDIHNQGCPA